MTGPIVSVVIATRNRPDGVHRLLGAIRSQDFDNFEVLVVDDHSDPTVVARYPALREELDERFRFVTAPEGQGGTGGPGLSRNRGIELAKGRYVAFCDDDDTWIRPDHLRVAVQAMDERSADLYFAGIRTSVNGRVKNPDMYAFARQALTRKPLVGSAAGDSLFEVGREAMADLLLHRIIHSDTLVVRRSLYGRAGLYWDKLRFAEDQDMAFRLVDAASRILYRPEVVGDFDVSPHDSIAHRYDQKERTLFGILSSLHAEFRITDPGLRAVARRNRSWRFLELATQLDAEGRPRDAVYFVMQSLLTQPSLSALKAMARLLRPRAFAPRPL